MQRVADELQARGAWRPSPRANFTAALCLAWPDGETAVFEGQVDGQLVWPPRGAKGFGYDPMFVPTATPTFGEMEPEAKHAISHRARAFALFAGACLGDGAAAEQDAGFGVYIHWPFCLSKCPYCDFNSHVRAGGIDEARFRARSCAELRPGRSWRPAAVRSRSSSAAARPP